MNRENLPPRQDYFDYAAVRSAWRLREMEARYAQEKANGMHHYPPAQPPPPARAESSGPPSPTDSSP